MRSIKPATAAARLLAGLAIVGLSFLCCSASFAAESRSHSSKPALNSSRQTSRPSSAAKTTQWSPRPSTSLPQEGKRAQAVVLRGAAAKVSTAVPAPAPRPNEPEDGITRLVRVNGEWIRMPIVIRETEP